MTRRLLLICLLCGASWLPAFAQVEPPYPCHWATGPITLDGRLDEPAWRSATRLTRWLVPPASAQPSPPAHPLRPHTWAVARLLWDGRMLYLGVRMQDRDLCDPCTGHDPPFVENDVVELYLEPSVTSTWYYEFHVTPGGATRDYGFAKRGAGPGQKYESGMQAAVRLVGTLNQPGDRDRYWTAELAIPLSALRDARPLPRPGDRWQFMVARYDRRAGPPSSFELSCTANLPAPDFHLSADYPSLIFLGPEEGKG